MRSAALHGSQAIPVTVEVAVSSGIPGFVVVGMADTAVQESRERVKSAIQSCGFRMPYDKVTVNIAPGTLRKSGTAFDLPIALGILAATGQIEKESVEGSLFVGELSLEGPILAPVGLLAYGICAYQEGLRIVSAEEQPIPIDGLAQSSIRTLGQLHRKEPFDPVQRLQMRRVEEAKACCQLDYRDIAGHDIAKRAFMIAAAGRHNLLMIGPPGSGKTMLASRFTSILPKLSEEELLESAVVHSVSGLDVMPILEGRRPFRRPHHSASSAGLLGGGNPVRPGEVSLAHKGVLFLDELAEFKASVLQGLRQPMESKSVHLIRADSKYVFPADFQLIAASNPCPCGFYGDKENECKCTQQKVNAYQSKIGGPLMDRIEIQLEVQRISAKSVLSTGSGTPSSNMREKVLAACEFSDFRNSRSDACQTSKIEGLMPKGSKPESVVRECKLESDAQRFLLDMAQVNRLSARSIMNILRVGRTIADLSQSDEVGCEHLGEAFTYRVRNGGE